MAIVPCGNGDYLVDMGQAMTGWFEIRLPDQASLDALRVRLEAAGAALEAQEGGLLTQDPAQNQILLTVQG
mgnify:CR=1 FL=1